MVYVVVNTNKFCTNIRCNVVNNVFISVLTIKLYSDTVFSVSYQNQKLTKHLLSALQTATPALLPALDPP